MIKIYLAIVFNLLYVTITVIYGSVSEWLKEADCKSVAYRYVGSNPTRPILKLFYLIKINFRKLEWAFISPPFSEE